MASDSPTPWKSRVRPPVDGEPVSASVAGRGVRDNEQRTRHTKDRLDAIEAGRSLVLYDRPMASTLKPWQAVYLDDDGIWKPAALATDPNSTVELIGLNDTSRVLGMVLRKTGAQIGDVIHAGEGLAESPILDVLDDTFVPGVYYLSSVTPGNLSRVRTQAPVKVCTIMGPNSAGVYQVFVHPAPQEEIEQHAHYRIELTAAPAGTPNCAGETDLHTVEVPDASLPGWLPVGHSTFDGMTIPAGAKFGYNIQQDQILKKVWPPVPAGFGVVDANWGQGYVGITGDMVEINEYGIWWMENGYGNAPWSPDYPCGDSSSSGDAEAISFVLSLVLWLTKATFGGAGSVSTLVAADASVVVNRVDGVDATRGDLQVRVATPSNVELLTGNQVVKGYNPATATLYVGPGVTGIKSLSPNVLLSGGTVASDGSQSGIVGITFVDPNANADLPIETIALNNVEETDQADVLFLNMPASQASEIRVKAAVPAFTLSTNATASVRLRFWVLARSLVTLSAAGLSATYREVELPDGYTPNTLPGADTAMDISASLTAAGSLSTNEYVEILSLPVEVTPGSLLYFTIAKTDSASEIGLLRVRAVLEVS